jgi:putative transcriptional regulator
VRAFGALRSVWNRIRELRWFAGPDDVYVDQASLAEAVGVTRQTINAIENGRRIPNLRLAIAIARHFGTTVEEVFDPDREPRPRRVREEDEDWDPNLEP